MHGATKESEWIVTAIAVIAGETDMNSRTTKNSTTPTRETRKTELVRLTELRTADTHASFMKQHLPQASIDADLPDETWILVEDGKIAGHFSLWYCDTPDLNGQSVGFIGHYFAANRRVAANVLASATKLLKQYGCELAIGPVDGNTWRRYRLVCGTTGVKSFLMEPENPMEFPGHFIDSGFESVATYSSSILEVKPDFLDKNRLSSTDSSMLDQVSIRSIDMNRFEQELHSIYGIACDAFSDAFLYAEISELEFITRYRHLRSVVNPDLVLIAEYDNHPVGFMLAIPDLANSNSDTKTVVAKTIGRVKDDRLNGLGRRLMAECHARADKMGFTNMIHALYKDDNSSSTYSTMHGAHVFRKYAVYGKGLWQ